MPLDSEAGQGTILGLFFFCITFNGAWPDKKSEQVGDTKTKPKKTRKQMNKTKEEWVNDLSLRDCSHILLSTKKGGGVW